MPTHDLSRSSASDSIFASVRENILSFKAFNTFLLSEELGYFRESFNTPYT